MERGLTGNKMKYIAAAAMVVDHIGMVFLSVQTIPGLLCRIVGRLTAPIMIYLLTEKNYIVPGEKQQTPKATVKIKRAAAKQIVDGSMEAIKEKESLGIQEEETLSASEIQQEINNLLEEISAAEDSLKQTTEHDEEISELIIGLTKSISESTVLKGRYDALRTRYEADMRRLTFIA